MQGLAFTHACIWSFIALANKIAECSRVETEKRLTALGISRIYLPDFTTDKPNSPHVAILAPPPDILKTRKRIVVIVNDSIQDLGILAYRQLQRELGLNGASVVDFAKELIKRTVKDTFVEKYNDIFEDGFEVDNKDDIPGLIVMNTGQLLYSYKYNKSMTLRSWSAMPRKSAVHEMIRIHEQENRISGHRDPQEHIQSVFDDILCNPDRVAPNAEVYLIAIENGADHSISLLTSNCKFPCYKEYAFANDDSRKIRYAHISNGNNLLACRYFIYQRLNLACVPPSARSRMAVFWLHNQSIALYKAATRFLRRRRWRRFSGRYSNLTGSKTRCLE